MIETNKNKDTKISKKKVRKRLGKSWKMEKWMADRKTKENIGREKKEKEKKRKKKHEERNFHQITWKLQ